MSETPMPQVAHLDPPAIAKVEAMERTLGDVYVVAYEKPMTPAQLTPEQVNILQKAERDLGVCLVAYRAS